MMRGTIKHNEALMSLRSAKDGIPLVQSEQLQKVRRAFIFKIVGKRKRPNTRAKLIINSTDTYACQTCFILHTNYLRDVTCLIRLYFLTRIKRTQYMRKHAPLIIQGVCVRSVHMVMGYLKIKVLSIQKSISTLMSLEEESDSIARQ